MKSKKKYDSVLKNINNKFDNKNFEYILSNLTLEVSAKALNGKLFGYPIYKNVQHIVRESLVRFALRFCNSQEKAANMLGIDVRHLKLYISKHDLNINKGGGDND